MTEVAPSNTQTFSVVQNDEANSMSRRSSSQASRASSGDSRRNRTVRGPRRHSSKATLPKDDNADPSLTSFPSLSPEPDNSETKAQDDMVNPARTVSQKLRERKATLAGLTSASPSLNRQNALFDDSPRPSLDIPGSLHLASDDHIERLIAKGGAVKLVRQYAQDLAQRDAEISAIRVKADIRERELKRMLREVHVPSAEIEKRLMKVEIVEISTSTLNSPASEQRRGSRLSIDGLMSEAMTDERSLDPINQSSKFAKDMMAPPSGFSRQTTNTMSAELISRTTASSHTSSRASSVASQRSQDLEATPRPKQPNANANRLAGIFQPSSTNTSYFIGGSNKTLKKPKAVDELSVRSNQSSKSTSSWTRLFGGRAQQQQQNRSRASSLDQPQPNDQAAGSEDLAYDSLRKIRTQTITGNNKSKLSVTPVNVKPQGKRNLTATRLSTSPSHIRKDSNASNQPPTVEMDSMIESSQLPPTMANRNMEGLLTDRYGFIYDHKRKRQQIKPSHQKNKPSASESLASFRSGDMSPIIDRPDTPLSNEDDLPKKSWQDYLMPATNVNRGRPRELLAHTPSAGAVVTVNTAGAEGTITPPRHRDASISMTSTGQKALPSASSVIEPQSSSVTVTSAGFSHETEDEVADASASKALLDQLTELHDALQAERTIKWNDFLRRVRAERANAASDRAANNTPEADLVNGELIGIATLGRSSKTKAKYVHFKSLVLSGIPVGLRPKIWAECSGAVSLRIPGYYEDLVTRSEESSDVDPEIASQIRADVKRTLRDNVFFRSPNAPGVQRLEELLLAYSLHNPHIGYCQGMNLITASLLLICATSEDCFWLLVAIIDHILPSGYFDHSLLVARADQIVLRQYVAEVLPKLDAKLAELGVELEACTFHWFISLYTGVLTGGEALYRVWDVVLCLNSSDTPPIALQPKSAASALGVEGYLTSGISQPVTPTTPLNPEPSRLAMGGNPARTNNAEPNGDSTISNIASETGQDHDGTSSPFLFQLSLALLKLNEPAILALDSAAMVYTYLNHNMTAHNITIDALVNAAEMLRGKVKRSDVLERRRKAVEILR